jgi:hypothetical protein
VSTFQFYLKPCVLARFIHIAGRFLIFLSLFRIV